ncbi:MAG: DUF2949 domain-containing protein [Cyanobacteria bacterium]|nr:DUF2949 domain-containing protein [Cyanobacteriota bacterium]MDA0867659.1 DUF2949 domain-containing protein [Cyanobacteriota bacterium]
MTTAQLPDLIEFLRRDLAVPEEAIALGVQRAGEASNLLPMVLWQYGLVNTTELEQIFDWLEQRPLSNAI